MEGTNLKEQRKKNLPKGNFGEIDGQTVNGGIGDGRNEGGPAYCVDTVKDEA